MGAAEGRSGGQNTWVIDMLLPGDVLVVDLFGKIEDGTFIGDNLGTAIAARAGTGSSSTAAFAIWSASTSSPTSMSSPRRTPVRHPGCHIGRGERPHPHRCRHGDAR